jgi:hypothetical protein
MMTSLFACAVLMTAPKIPNANELARMQARFAPVSIKAPVAKLPSSEQKALAEIVAAAKIMDSVFLRQVSGDAGALLLSLALDKSPLGRARLDYFLTNKGPWSRLDDNAAFLPGVGKKPAGATFYPSDATKDELETWFASLKSDAKAIATGFYSTIRRDAQRRLTAVPFSVEYQDELSLAAAHLEAAAKLTADATLQKFLVTRAKAFLTNDYYESDLAWMGLDAAIEPTMGPYEVYEDEWFNFSTRNFRHKPTPAAGPIMASHSDAVPAKPLKMEQSPREQINMRERLLWEPASPSGPPQTV